MQTKFLGWSEDEIRSLLQTILMLGDGKISSAFHEHASKFDRKPTSVRNFYYNFIKLAKTDTFIQSQFADILNILPAQDMRRFDQKSEQKLLLAILEDSEQISVRQKCLQLANFDRKKFLRIQNKYQNLLKNKPNLVKKCVFLLKKAQKPVRQTILDNINPQPKNIINMPVQHQKILTDSEINSLFIGLVNLVKENTKIPLQKEIKYFNSALQKSLVELRKKDTIIQELTDKNNHITSELNQTKEKLQSQMEKNTKNILTISDLAKSKKMQKLHEFLEKITKNTTFLTKN